MFCESSRSFTDLLKLRRLPVSRFTFTSRSIVGRNEVDLGQFETALVLQHDARHGSPSFTSDNDKALIGPEPYLEGVFCPVWMRTDFFETELSKECERFPDGLGEFLLRGRLHHLPSPFRHRGQPRGSSSHRRAKTSVLDIPIWIDVKSTCQCTL